MARKYPRFLLSETANTKSKGSFIIHTLKPQFIVTVEFSSKRNIQEIHSLEVWETEADMNQVQTIISEIPQWYRNSGRFSSSHPEDKMMIAIQNLSFLKDEHTPFKLDELRTLVQLIFTQKEKNLCKFHSNYGLKTLMEWISEKAIKTDSGRKKYCDQDLMTQAFELEGFRSDSSTGSTYFNINLQQAEKANQIYKY